MKIARAARAAARLLHLHALAWKLRKLDFEIGRGDLVLDAGGGAAPNPLADIVIDNDPAGRQTLSGPARSNGKALVWADLQRLPFRDRAFDYVLCFHVLEHVIDPAAALNELQRVARAGYLETPNELFDIVVPYRDHRNRVSFDGVRLRISRKPRWDIERFEERFGLRRVRQIYELLSADPENLHVQCYWRGRVAYTIDDDAPGPFDDGGDAPRVSIPAAAVHRLLSALATCALRRPRLTEQELLSLMLCIDCSSMELALDEGGAACSSCGRRFPRLHGFLDFRPEPSA